MNKKVRLGIAGSLLVLAIGGCVLWNGGGDEAAPAKTVSNNETVAETEIIETEGVIDTYCKDPSQYKVISLSLNCEPQEVDNDGIEFTEVDETVYATFNVNIREYPDQGAEKVGLLPGDKSIQRIGYNEEWSKVVYKNAECYIATEYLTDRKPEPVVEVVATEEPQSVENIVEENVENASDYVEEPAEETSDEGTDGMVYLGNFKITAYCGGSCCNGKWAGTTSTGVAPSEGRTIAVAPSVIPYGSTVYIDGVGYRVAEDTGGFANRNSYQIDLYMDSHSTANNWGVQYRDVWIVE